MAELSIIIINYNTTDFIRKCINSINNKFRSIEKEIIVVDNNSPQRDIKNLESEYPDTRFIYSDVNRGFGAGCNIGVENSSSEFILFLNPDIIVKKNSLSILLNYIKVNKDVSVCSGILTDENGNITYSFNDFPSLSWEFREAYGLFLKSKIKKMTSRYEIRKKIPFEVDWFHGAALLIRRDAFEKVQGFDENIFLYYEDVDLQKKIRELGHKIVCIPEAEFYHYERSSVRDKDSQKTYYFYMHYNKLYYYKKYNMHFKIIIIRFMYISGSIIKFISIFLRPKLRNQRRQRFLQYRIIIGVYLNLIKKI
jgi:hypothetical protein